MLKREFPFSVLVAAAAKGESDLALGNVVGSNIFNILLILGASSVIVPLTVGTEIIYDTAILIGMSERVDHAFGICSLHGLYHHAVMRKQRGMFGEKRRVYEHFNSV